MTYGISMIATQVTDVNFWEIAKEKGLKGIKEYFSSQIELFNKILNNGVKHTMSEINDKLSCQKAQNL